MFFWYEASRLRFLNLTALAPASFAALISFFASSRFPSWLTPISAIIKTGACFPTDKFPTGKWLGWGLKRRLFITASFNLNRLSANFQAERFRDNFIFWTKRFRFIKFS